MPRSGLATALVVGAALVLGAAAVFMVIYVVVLPALHVASDSRLVGAVLGALAVMLAAGTTFRATRQREDDVQGILAATAPWLPGALAVAIVALFLLGQSAAYALGIGTLFALVAWLAIGITFRKYASVDQAEPRNRAALDDRLKHLLPSLDAVSAPGWLDEQPEGEVRQMAAVARDELRAFVDSIAADLRPTADGQPPKAGQRWITGTGYTDLWDRVHRAEELLILLVPTPEVLKGAKSDRLRLSGSNIEEADLVAMLDAAVVTLNNANASPTDRARTRGELQVVRYALNRYSDQLWDKILRGRNQLLRTMILTGITAVGALALALIAGADHTVVIGAAAFYMVGAVVGLFSRLRSESQPGAITDDYGFAYARLVSAPLISGLGAIAGVVLTAKILVPTSDFVDPATVDDSGKVTTEATAPRTPASLHDIFDIGRNPSGLIVAAVFGLTPGLVLDRLQKQAEQYKSDIQKSSVTPASPDPSADPKAKPKPKA